MKQMDEIILTKAQQELELEAKKKVDLKQKVLKIKQQQDEMLVKAQEQKHKTFKAMR